MKNSQLFTTCLLIKEDIYSISYHVNNIFCGGRRTKIHTDQHTISTWMKTQPVHCGLCSTLVFFFFFLFHRNIHQYAHNWRFLSHTLTQQIAREKMWGWTGDQTLSKTVQDSSGSFNFRLGVLSCCRPVHARDDLRALKMIRNTDCSLNMIVVVFPSVVSFRDTHIKPQRVY